MRKEKDMKWIWGSENTCNYDERSTFNNPVHQHSDGSWWFYDETWSQELGPFSSEQLCKDSCKKYVEEL